MISKRAPALLMVAAVTALLGCQDSTDMMAPTAPQMAKGGKPGKPDGGTYRLLEYFVYRGADATDYVHVVGEGEVEAVNLNAVQDYFFNGIRDDNDSPHYEYTTFTPGPVAPEPGLEEGTFHIDVPWNGETREWDPAAQTYVDDYYRDFLIADVDGDGADPFAFDVRFQTQAGDFLAAYQPQGVVLDGQETYEAYLSGVASAYHQDVSQVYSYATSKGDPADGEVFLTSVALSNVSCEIVTIREGRGKDKTTRDVARVTGTASVRTGSTSGETPSTWMELHLVDVTTGTPVFARGAVFDDGNPADGVDVTLTQDFSTVHQSPMLVHLAVDYVYPTREYWSFAYDPSQNTEAGFFTDWPGPATQVGDPWPVAYAPVVPIAVTCQ